VKIVKTVQEVSEMTSEDGQHRLVVVHLSSNVPDEVMSKLLHQLTHMQAKPKTGIRGILSTVDNNKYVYVDVYSPLTQPIQDNTNKKTERHKQSRRHYHNIMK